MKTTKIDDSTVVLLDFSRSGASEFHFFFHPCWLSFSTPLFDSLFARFLLDVGVHFASKVDAFAYIFLHSFLHMFKKLCYQKTHFHGAGKGTRRHQHLTSGALVKHYILRKAKLLYGSVAFFYKRCFAWPLGKGQGVR